MRSSQSTDEELRRFHPDRWEFEEATRELHFTKDFNSAVEAVMRDPMATIGERVLAWIKRRAWGNFSLYCVSASGAPPLYQADCATELDIDKRRISDAISYYVARGYVEMRGTAKMLYPLISPSLTAPPAGPAKKSGEYRTFLQLWQTAHSAEFADLKSARDTVLRIQSSILADYKAWRKKSGECGQNSPASAAEESPDSADVPSPAPRTDSAAIKEESERENLARPPAELFDHLAAVARYRRPCLGAPNEQTLRNFWQATQLCNPGADVPAIANSVVRILEDNQGIRTWGGAYREFRNGAARQILEYPQASQANRTWAQAVLTPTRIGPQAEHPDANQKSAGGGP
jgi:hypothetical protein